MANLRRGLLPYLCVFGLFWIGGMAWSWFAVLILSAFIDDTTARLIAGGAAVMITAGLMWNGYRGYKRGGANGHGIR